MDHQKSGQSAEVDLFGHPLTPIRDRRGRPSFAKTLENREFVAVRAAAGWSHKRISEALDCDDDTLRKHFSGELENGRTYIEGLMLDVLIRRVREGHTPSIRQLQDRLDAAAPSGKPHRVQPGEKDDDAARGKKQVRLDDAQNVPDEYGDIYAMRRPI